MNATGQTSIDSCICKAPDYFQHDGKCVDGCPLGWFRDSATRQCNSCDSIADATLAGFAIATGDCAATMQADTAVDVAEQALADAGCSRDAAVGVVATDAEEDAACAELRNMLDGAIKAVEEAGEALSDGSAGGGGEGGSSSSKTVAALAALLGIISVVAIVVGALYYRKSQEACDSRGRPAGRRRSATNTAAAAARAPRRGQTTQNPTFHYQNDAAIAGGRNASNNAPHYSNADVDGSDNMYSNNNDGDLYLAPQSEAEFLEKQATLEKSKGKSGSAKASPGFNSYPYDEVEPVVPERRRNQGKQQTSVTLDSDDEGDGEMDV